MSERLRFSFLLRFLTLITGVFSIFLLQVLLFISIIIGVFYCINGLSDTFKVRCTCCYDNQPFYSISEVSDRSDAAAAASG